MTIEILTASLSYHNIDPEIFRIGPFVLRWYSLGYILGLLFGWWYLMKLADEPKAPMTRPQADSFLLWATFGVILGGRLGYVLFYNLPFYMDNPSGILRVWDGGMSFHGGLLGVMAAVILFAKKHSINLFAFADRLALVSPMGILLVRVTNFINGELWGAPSNLPWAMVFPGGGDEPRHPSQLYEAGLEGLLLLVVLNLLYHKTRIKEAPGQLAGLFFIGYGFSRYLVEFVREPDAHLGLIGGVMSMGQILTLPMIAFGLWMILHAKKKHAN